MDVKVAQLDHVLGLETKEEHYNLLLRLPDGALVTAAISCEAGEHIVVMVRQGSKATKVPTPVALAPKTYVPRPSGDYRELERPVDEHSGIMWSELPDTVVSDTMKESLRLFGIQEPITVEDLEVAMANVSRLAEAQRLTNEPSIRWHDEAPRGQKAAPPIRFPQKTDAGYPVVSRTKPSTDLGEVTADADEDGIDQL